MDHSKDELRRDLAEVREEQRLAMGGLKEIVQRIFGGDGGLSQEAKGDLVLGGLHRRRFLAIGGLSVATAAVIAACGEKVPPGVPQTGQASTTTALQPQDITDAVLLRTASSLEHSAIQAYDAALGLNVLPADVADVAKTFRDQHQEHAAFFEKATKDAGGTPFTKSNPAIDKNIIAPGVVLIGKQDDKATATIAFANGLENIAAGTYLSIVPTLSQPKLRQAAMSVGGVEARHAAVLTKLLPYGQIVELVATGPAPTTTAAATTIQGATTTASTANIAPVYQVPGPFASLAPVPIVIGTEEIDVALPGPNSYIYTWVQ